MLLRGTGANRPTLTAGSANSGILSSITFDGTSDHLTLPTDFANPSAGASVFAIVKPSSSVATEFHLFAEIQATVMH